MKTNFKYGFSPKETEEIFQDADKDNDGKLILEEFLYLILPEDYVLNTYEDSGESQEGTFTLKTEFF